MTYTVFILSLISLCVASLTAFVSSLRRRSLELLIFVPLIALSGSLIYFSYHEVLGFPVQRTWEKMGKRFTVIFFRIKEKESITLWTMEKNKTRLVELPHLEAAEEAMEKQRAIMGKGIPVTFLRQDGKMSRDAGAGAEPGGLEDGDSGGQGGWNYIIESKGNPIPGTDLPPKRN